MRATPASWEHKPFKDVVPIPYQATFNAMQFARLRMGLVPQEMEDKWFIYFDEPYLCVHRSWTGQPVYRLMLKQLPDGAEVAEAPWSREIADAASTSQGPDYQTRLLDFLLSNLILGQSKPFPMPSGFQEAAHGVFQHHISGTGYRQSRTKPHKPNKS
jgi:hypothetical protein